MSVDQISAEKFAKLFHEYRRTLAPSHLRLREECLHRRMGSRSAE
jgi:hypothetical protein